MNARIGSCVVTALLLLSACSRFAAEAIQESNNLHLEAGAAILPLDLDGTEIFSTRASGTLTIHIKLSVCDEAVLNVDRLNFDGLKNYSESADYELLHAGLLKKKNDPLYIATAVTNPSKDYSGPMYLISITSGDIGCAEKVFEDAQTGLATVGGR